MFVLVYSNAGVSSTEFITYVKTSAGGNSR